MAARKRGKSNPERRAPAETILEHLDDERAQVERELAARYRTQPEGFIRWCEEETCVLDKQSNTWVPFRFEDWQKREVRKVLAVDAQGEPLFLTHVWCWPRRHGKSQISARYDIWRCRNWRFQNIVIGSNSKDQTLSTAFEIAVATIRNSPSLKRELDAGEIEILGSEIRFRRTNSKITGIPTSEASAYGQAIHVGHITELCKARDDALYQVVASSTGDTHHGTTICDSNVGSVDNKVWELIQLAESGEDPTIGVSYVHYRDLDDAIARSPRWIDPAWLRSRAKQMTPGEFRRNHLNIPATAGEKLFSPEQVDRVFATVPAGWGRDEPLPAIFSREDFLRLQRVFYAGVCYRGGGLDRALPFSKRGNRTFWCVLAKGLSPKASTEEVEVFDDDGNIVGYQVPDPWDYCVLNLVDLTNASETAIERVIEANLARYGGLDNVSFEQYQAADIFRWAQNRGIASELTHFTTPVQLDAYSDFYRVVSTGRFHASPLHWLLRAELLNVEEDDSGSVPKFGGPVTRAKDPQGRTVRIKDDSAEAVINALRALREMTSLPQGPPRSVKKESVFARR